MYWFQWCSAAWSEKEMSFRLTWKGKWHNFTQRVESAFNIKNKFHSEGVLYIFSTTECEIKVPREINNCSEMFSVSVVINTSGRALNRRARSRFACLSVGIALLDKIVLRLKDEWPRLHRSRKVTCLVFCSGEVPNTWKSQTQASTNSPLFFSVDWLKWAPSIVVLCAHKWKFVQCARLSRPPVIAALESYDSCQESRVACQTLWSYCGMHFSCDPSGLFACSVWPTRKSDFLPGGNILKRTAGRRVATRILNFPSEKTCVWLRRLSVATDRLKASLVWFRPKNIANFTISQHCQSTNHWKVWIMQQKWVKLFFASGVNYE